MAKKITLTSRKRTKELTNKPVQDTKKQELLALKASSQMPTTNAHQPKIDDFANELYAYYQQLSSLGDKNRYTYSKRTREAMLIDKIRHAMYQQAFINQKAGMKRKENLQACQCFTDNILNCLNKLGLKLNTLFVSDADTLTENP